jgi:hypothetical protein
VTQASSPVREVTDFSEPRFGARGYLERVGVLDAIRGPLPVIAPGDWRVHSIPLVPPLPPAELQGRLLGESPPDRGQTLDWPHPSS